MANRKFINKVELDLDRIIELGDDLLDEVDEDNTPTNRQLKKMGETLVTTLSDLTKLKGK